MIGLSLWQRLCDNYAVPGAVTNVAGLDRSGSARDGDLESIAQLLSRAIDPSLITVSLNRSEKPFSDVVVVFSGKNFLEHIQVEVSSDGVQWQKPYSVERWSELLWIWDFHQRPWRYLRLSGFKSPEEASIREVFAIFSPRHSE